MAFHFLPKPSAPSVLTYRNQTALTLIHALLLTVLVACGPAGRGNGPKTDITVVIQPSGTNLSGIDMSGFEQVSQPLSSGGAVALPDGTAINVAPGVTDGSVTVGLRPSSRGPAAGNDVEGDPVSPWIDAAVSTSDFDANPDAPFTIQVPVIPPDEAIGHPGLQLTLVMPDGSTFPMEGSYDPFFGTFSTQLLSLPPRFQFAVTFNENIVRIDSADVPNAAYGRQISSALTEGPWSTTDFVIDFNGNKVTMEQARKVARTARAAATNYSAAGFAEPFLYKETTVMGERWHIHLTNKGSCFDGNHDSAAEDISRRFGRLFVSIDRIDSPATHNTGTVTASIAHEMFHAILFAYKIPSVCFNYVEGGTTYCYRSYAGFNEGAATAVGYAIDQGSPKPRPAEGPAPLILPVGYFDHNQRWLAYMNQDFFVFLLRVGSLSNVERMLRTLKTAVMPAAPTNTLACLTAYGNALESGGVGLDVGFTEMVGGYVANRGFIREPEGHIWPAEPNGGQAGAMYVLDGSLFATNHYELDERDCNLNDDESMIECTATLSRINPFAGAVFSIGYKSIADEWDLNVETITATAESTGGQMAFWLAAEKDGQGEEGSYLGAMPPAGATLAAAGLWTDAHVLATQGPSAGDITVNIQMAAAMTGLTYTGTGMIIDMYSPVGGQPGSCTQFVPMRLEIEHLPGWVDLTFTDQEVQFGYNGADGTCSLLDATWNESLYNTSHEPGQFSIGTSPSTGNWVNGTYDQETASGQGISTYGEYSREIQFNLTRVK